MLIEHFDTDEKVLLIAEIGNNHEGNFSLAKEMIAAAAESGADMVKFQTIVPEHLVSPLETERIKQLGRFRFSYDQFAELASVAADHGIMFMSTPFDIDSLHAIAPYMPAIKIASPDNTFFPLIQAAALTGKPLILSCGLCHLEEVAVIHTLVTNIWSEHSIESEMALLHCISAYPTPDNEANLGAINDLARFDTTVGYSDHTLGIEAAALSVAAGARIVEKHFTLDKNFSDFRDHQLSADPDDFHKLATRIRRTEALMGHGNKTPANCEEPGQIAFRRSIVAAGNLPKGTVIKQHHLDWVRPGGGLPPGMEDALIDKTLLTEKRHGEIILAHEVE